jgi:hypothetical protein
MASIEQRSAPRFRFLGFASLPCEISVGSKSWAGMITNASETGLGVEVKAVDGDLICDATVNIHLALQGEKVALGGRLTHVASRDAFNKLRFGAHLFNGKANHALHDLCLNLAQSGRATGLSLKHVADEGHIISIHGALSLKTATDAINIISSNRIARLDLSACRLDGKVGSQLGAVAVGHGVKISGCNSQLSQMMLHAGVCSACRSC